MSYKNQFPAFSINMSSCPERWETMQRRFATANLDVKRWEAATPETLGSLNYAQYLSPGQRGCAKSHFDLWKYQVELEIPIMMIFEDDAVLRKDFWDILQPKLESIQKEDPEWDMLLLNASEAHGTSWHKAKNQCMTACYVLSLRGAQELYRVAQHTLYASDWMTQILQNRNHSYTFFPWLVIQEENLSIIRNEKNTADWEKVKRLLGEAKYGLENYDF